MKKSLVFVCTLVSVFCMVYAAGAAPIILSTTGNATLGGLSFKSGDLVRYDPATNTATLFFSVSLFSTNENIDAVSVLNTGHIILSTADNATLGGLFFRNGDLVKYNPVTNTATLFFNESLFSQNENVDAISVLGNGNLILSATDSAKLGGLSFTKGDLIEYNPITGQSSLFFNQDLFTAGNEQIDGVDVLSNGHLILSTNGTTTLGGLTFRDGDLAEYDPTTNIATLFFNENLFGADENIDAVSTDPVPEPSTWLLFVFGLLAIGGGQIIRRKNVLTKA